jgi:hypothetical protein
MKTQEAFARLAYLHTLRYWKGGKLSIGLKRKSPLQEETGFKYDISKSLR